MKVLLATDGSKHAEEAGMLLAHLPHNERLELTIISVTPTPSVHGSRDVVEWMQQHAKAERLRALKFCKRQEDVFTGADAQIETLIVEGHPGKAIVAEAKKREIDLIVLGATGHSTLDRMLIGSVSDFVATHAHCSVLVVRSDPNSETDHEGLNVTIAYDGSEQSQFALEDIANFKWGSKTHARLLNAVSFPFNYSEIPVDIDLSSVEEEMMSMLNEVAEQIRSVFPDIQSDVIEVNNPGAGLVHFAEECETDLIVLGDTGHGLIGRFLMGSVSRYVLHHAKCSVWLSRKSK